MSNLTAVIILASDKESLKKSLVHVDLFLKKVGQGIETERHILHSVGRTQTTRNRPVAVDGVSNEDYSKLWNETLEKSYIRNKASDRPNNKGKYLNFYKAIATLDEEKLNKGTTIKLVNAVQDLKGLVESDIDTKNRENNTKLNTLRQIQNLLKTDNGSKVVKNADAKTKKTKRDNDDEFDVFGGMDFPKDSNLPSGFTTKPSPVTGGGTPPEVLDDAFIIKHEEMPGPRPEIMATPSTTTNYYAPLLNPKDFGYTTTRRPLPTYGDVVAPPEIDGRYLTTTPAPDAFVASLKADMEKFHLGAFCIAVLKILHMVIWKSQPEGQRIVFGLGRSLGELIAMPKMKEFGNPFNDAVSQVAVQMVGMPYDEIRSEVVLLHNALLHRRELFSGDVNSLFDHIDSLYTRQETTELLQSLEPLEDYHGQSDIPPTITNTILHNFLAPWRRIKGTPRGNILKTALNRAIKSHFFPADNRYPDTRRGIFLNIPVEIIPHFRQVGIVTPAKTSLPNFRSGDVGVYKVDARRDDLNKNIYSADLQTIINNYFKTKINEQARKNAKPLFNQQLNNNLNIFNNKAVDKKHANYLSKSNLNFIHNKGVVNKPVNDLFNRVNEEQANNLRINLKAKITSKPMNNRIMIITNNNQAKSNDKPRAIFRSGDSYVDFGVMNTNDSLVNNANQFEVDMYPDGPIMVPQPQKNELNFQIEGDELNLQVDGDNKVIVINKKNNEPMERFGEDIDHKMLSSSALRKRNHHRKHHKHKRTHGHTNLKEKLAKIKKIVKMYRHKKHRHRKHKKEPKSLSIKEDTSPPFSTVTRNLLNATKTTLSDRIYQQKDSVSTGARTLSPGFLLDYTTQMYSVQSNFINLRRQMVDGVKKFNLAKQEVESDDEISLKKNLYKAMNIGGRRVPKIRDKVKVNKRRLLRDPSETDEEAQLKNNIYSYFNNIQPA